MSAAEEVHKISACNSYLGHYNDKPDLSIHGVGQDEVMAPKHKVKPKKYSFKGKVWKYKGHAGWYFVTLPRMLSKTIRQSHGLSEEGWGRLRADASIEGRH